MRHATVMFEHVVEATLPGMVTRSGRVSIFAILMKPDMPLADHARCITLSFQLLRQDLHNFLLRQAEVMIVVCATESTLVHTGQQTCT